MTPNPWVGHDDPHARIAAAAYEVGFWLTHRPQGLTADEVDEARTALETALGITDGELDEVTA